jgi:hypothetical protein
MKVGFARLRALPALGAVLAVLGIATPAQAGINFTVGGGYQSGLINFRAPGLPAIVPTPPPTTADGVVSMIDALSTGCPTATFDYVNLETGGVIYTQAEVGWTGPFSTVAAHGSSVGGECYSHGAGSFVIDSVAGSLVTGNTISCTNMQGSYTRNGAVVVASASGTCQINQYTFPATSITIDATLTPANIGGAVVYPLTSASLTGAFTVGLQ